MFSKMMIASMLALTAAAAPSMAQSTDTMGQSGSTPGGMQSAPMQGGAMQNDAMQDGSMDHSKMPKMSKTQMKSVEKCKAMPSDMLSKDRTCAKMMKMHPETINSRVM